MGFGPDSYHWCLWLSGDVSVDRHPGQQLPKDPEWRWMEVGSAFTLPFLDRSATACNHLFLTAHVLLILCFTGVLKPLGSLEPGAGASQLLASRTPELQHTGVTYSVFKAIVTRLCEQG